MARGGLVRILLPDGSEGRQVRSAPVGRLGEAAVRLLGASGRQEDLFAGTGHGRGAVVTIKGRRHYLGRAVDQDADTVDILLQPRRNQRAAERFFRRIS